MKFKPWERHGGSVFKLDMRQFEPLFRLRAILDNFKKVDLSNRTIDWVAENLKATINHQKIAYDYITDPSPVYRGQMLRQDEARPQNVSRVWYPPIERIKRNGRLNRKGQQVFYCSSTPKGVLVELDPKPLDMMCIMECALISDHPSLNLVELGIDRAFLAITKNVSQLAEHVTAAEKRHDSNLVIDGIPIGELSESYLIQKFFHEMLSHKPKDDNHDFYKITIAIGEIWSYNPNVAGIAYPGIATKFPDGNYMAGHNMAVRKESADLYYKPTTVWLCKCSYITGKKYGLEIVSSSNKVDASGNIEWTNDAVALPESGQNERPTSRCS